MDVIEDVLGNLHLRSSVFCRMALAAGWGFSKDPLAGVPFHIVISGQAVITGGTVGETYRMAQGDIAILPGGDAHELLHHEHACRVPFSDVLNTIGVPPWQPGHHFETRAFHYGQESDAAGTVIISGVFHFGDRSYTPLLSGLPKVLLLRQDNAGPEQHALAQIVSLLDREISSDHTGRGTVSAHLTDILFIYALRAWLATDARSGAPGLLRGLADRYIASVLQEVHQRPEARWSLDAMAATAGQSRSRFAEHFRTVMGMPPLTYVTDWRMRQAARRLLISGSRLASISELAGYRSEASFSKAFQKWAGCTPARFRRERGQARDESISG